MKLKRKFNLNTLKTTQFKVFRLNLRLKYIGDSFRNFLVDV
jgi:hypothetical protein